MAKGIGVDLAISTKSSIEICNRLRKKSVARAKVILQDAMDKKVPIEFTRFTNGAGHKRGIGAGRFPVNAAREILALLKNVEANAQFKGLNTSNLIIEHISAQNAGNQWRYGRHRRRKMKKTHIEVVVKEGKKEEKKTAAKPATEKKGEGKKVETKKPEVKSASPKAVEKKAEPVKAAPKAEEKKAAEKPKEDKPKPEVKKEAPAKKPVEEKPAAPSTEKKEAAPKKETPAPKQTKEESTKND